MANSVVMRASVQEKKMHYPVMTERQIASRWKISLKTQKISVRLLPRKITCCGWPGRISLGKRAIAILYFEKAPTIPRYNLIINRV